MRFRFPSAPGVVTIGVVVIGVVVISTVMLPNETHASTRATSTSASSIHAVDFRNFTYEQGTDPSITVKNGVFDRSKSVDDPEYFEVLDVAYGDFNGDGSDDAIVTTLLNTGGTGQFSEPRLFVLANGNVDQVGSLGVGDRADGGVHDAFVRNGRIVVDNYGQNGTGACCPTYIDRTTFAFRGKGPVPIGRSVRRAFLGIDTTTDNKLRFLAGSTVATVEGDAGGSAFFDANKGQRVSLAVGKRRVDSGSGDAIITLRQSGSGVIGVVRTGGTWTGVLPAKARYTLSWTKASVNETKRSGFATVEVTIR